MSTTDWDGSATWLAADGVVALRPLAPPDADAHLAGIDEAVLRSLGTDRRPTADEVSAWLTDNARAWATGGPVVDLGLVEIASGELVGVVGFQRDLDHLAPGQVNLTYTLYAGRRGRGLASRGVDLVMTVAAGRADVEEFIIRVARWNRASSAVARRLGFVASHVTDDEHGRLRWWVRPGRGSRRRPSVHHVPRE
jgi:RimJ/RimL family protein N-acetyltransferase